MSGSALILKDIGKNFYLEKTDIETTPPESGEIVVKVQAVGLNPVDAKLAVGGHPAWKYPFVPGLDGAGVVVETGSAVSHVKTGDLVTWHGNLLKGGALAEYATIPAHIVSVVPSGISATVAASIPCAGLTAWNALQVRMHLAKGMTILIEAGAGGVGGFAIQIAKLMGLHVITTASPANHDYVQSLGADHVINYKHPQIEQEILAANNGEKLDAVLDSIGGPVASRDLNLLKHEGQYASLLGLPQADPGDVFTVSPTVYLISLGSAHLAQSYAAQCRLAKMGDGLLGELAKGTITPLPIKEIPFTDTAVTTALHHQLEGHVTGKQVVVFS